MHDDALVRRWFETRRGELTAHAADWLGHTVDALATAQGQADSMQQAGRLFHAQITLSRAERSLPARLVQRLEQDVLKRLPGGGTIARTTVRLEDAGLVDDDVVLETIEISRLVETIQSSAEWELREAEASLSQALGRTVLGLRGSPLHPEVVVRAIWLVTEELQLTADERVACLRATSAQVADFARAVYACARDFLGEADLSGQAVFHHVGDSRPQGLPPVDVFPHHGVSDAPLRARPGAPAPPSAGDPLQGRDEVFGRFSAMVERVLGDPRMTPDLRRVLCAMQMVVVRLAFAAPDTLYAPGHALWQAAGELIDYAARHCLHDRIAHDDFVLFVDDKVQALLGLPADDHARAAPHLEAIGQFVRSRAGELIAAEDDAVRHFARLEGRRREILDLAMTRQRELMLTALGETEVPFRLRQFLLADWVEVLARSECAEGPGAAPYREYWAAARTLLAHLKARGSVLDLKPTLERLQSVMAVIERGMSTIEAPSIEKHELWSVLTRWSAGTASRPVWHDTDPVPALDGSPAGGRAGRSFWGDRAGDTQGLTGSSGGPSAMPAADAQRWIDGLQPGRMTEIFLHGTWIEARVADIDEHHQIIVLEDEQSGHSHSLTRRALVRLAREGLVG
jgi:hypothetical protein